MSRNFMELLQGKWDEGKFVCVGLDSDENKLPSNYGPNFGPNGQLDFNAEIVKATRHLVCAYKPNLAYYRGSQGKIGLRTLIDYIRAEAPDVPVILDAKQGDIGNTNDGYVADDFYYFRADAVTVHPYMGMDAMKPFLDRADKGVIVLCRTSNPGAGQFQDAEVTLTEEMFADLYQGQPADIDSFEVAKQMPLYQYIAYQVSSLRGWNRNRNCAVVVGATNPDELREVRRIVGDMPILIPGIGAQGGDVEATVRAGANSRGQGMIINVSRSVIFASGGPDFAEAARRETQKLHDKVTAALSVRA